MHELSVAAALLERVESHADRLRATRVVAIGLVIGDRACIVDDSLRFSFDLLAPGTVAEGARIVVRRTPMRFSCPACDREYHPAGADFRCPDCDATGSVVDDGSALTIESVEIEQ